jgi:hypothetical protein
MAPIAPKARSLVTGTAPRPSEPAFASALPRSGSLAPCAGCALCGSDHVASDEAVDGGLWLLGECRRCGHRWTAGPFDGPTPAPARVRPLPPTPEGAAIVAA